MKENTLYEIEYMHKLKKAIWQILEINFYPKQSIS